MTTKILAIDPSTRTGFTVLNVVGTTVQVIHTEEFWAKPTKHPMERLGAIGSRLQELLLDFDPDHVVIEGYSFMSKHNLATMVEIGTIFRYFLWQWNYEYKEIPPSTLKKFITGKGNAKKDLVLLYVYKNWNVQFANDNVADSFGLAMYAVYSLLGIVDSKNIWKKSDAAHLEIIDLRE